MPLAVAGDGGSDSTNVPATPATGPPYVPYNQESKQHVLRPLSVVASGENTENRLLQFEHGSLRWWSELRPINVLRIGHLLISSTRSQWWKLGLLARLCASSSWHARFGVPEDVFFEEVPGIQLVSRLTRDGSPILEQTFFTASFVTGAPRCTRCLFQNYHRSSVCIVLPSSTHHSLQQLHASRPRHKHSPELCPHRSNNHCGHQRVSNSWIEPVKTKTLLGTSVFNTCHCKLAKVITLTCA